MEYNGLIREFSGKTLQIMARILVSDLKDFPEDWKIRYGCKEVDRNAISIKELCCSPKNPLQIYKPTAKSYCITIRTISGSSFPISVTADDTVKVLKLKIFQKNSEYPPQVQELNYSLKGNNVCLLLDWLNMRMLKVTSGSVIFLKPKTKALEEFHQGVIMKPIDMLSTFDKIRGQDSAPQWARYGAGINFCGTCPNPACVSKELGVEREVVARVDDQRFGEARINYIQKKGQLPCPGCAGNETLLELETPEVRQFMPTSFLVCDARSLIHLKRVGQDQVYRAMFQAKSKKESQFQRFEVEGKLEVVEVTTVEPWRSPFCCVRCDTKIAFKAHEFFLQCGHVYHKWCAPSILKGSKCKVCHAKILIVGKMEEALQVV